MRCNRPGEKVMITTFCGRLPVILESGLHCPTDCWSFGG